MTTSLLALGNRIYRPELIHWRKRYRLTVGCCRLSCLPHPWYRRCIFVYKFLVLG
nr:MAG TPA: cationic trypsin [Crassvirales sp.]